MNEKISLAYGNDRINKPFKNPLIRNILNRKITAFISSDKSRSGLQKKILKTLILEIINCNAMSKSIRLQQFC